ncbi:YdeI/OmpD-associated family protein [Xanthomarina gelatinilytica]|uniref:YdeI/OmpD-associated family protein n=1 Tax=Xanthomarina gelatinilytica TaxID=1137281 RepID=UPI003AA84124
MNTDVDLYFTEGCGRCPLGGTPQCKVHNWPEELKLLRKIALDCGLTEESKWGVPCYIYKGANVAIVSAFKDYAALSFFKGALLSDENNLLNKPDENSQAVRLFQFTKPQQIIEIEDLIKAYIFEAVEVEKAGLKVEFKKGLEPIPEELQNRLDEDPNLQSAFYSLTPGRQRSYILHISQAKQAKTRESRVEKCLPKIFSGKGFNEY